MLMRRGPLPGTLTACPSHFPTSPQTALVVPNGASVTAPRGADPTLLCRIRNGLIGDGDLIDGPFGPRRLTYADYTASGRSLDFIEDLIRFRVLPAYGNTHSEASVTGRLTTQAREQAREIIHRSVGARDDHVVLFCGSGSTAAVDKLVRLLGLCAGGPAGSGAVSDAERPVVFVGPFEHHSHELPWRESGAEVVAIGQDPRGGVDQDDLLSRLREYAQRPLRIGAFSAASNVTGIIADVDPISTLLHRFGALAVWDHTASAPYLPIRVSESSPGRGDHQDAAVFSPHKFVGGPQSPGVLVVRRELVQRPVPTVPGGGTIAFVDPSGALYADDPIAREEGGTPAIVESIRAGLAVALKDRVGTDVIAMREQRFWIRARERWLRNPHLEVLGDPNAHRLPVVSFRVHHRELLLHHHFVVAVLNDLFGIQTRGGCSCAGPYGHRLLCITPRRSAALRRQASLGYLGIKPGWIRISFNYFISDEVAEFLIDAVDMVATHGHRLLTAYTFDPRSGLWRHRRMADHGGAGGIERWLDDGLASGSGAGSSVGSGGVLDGGPGAGSSVGLGAGSSGGPGALFGAGVASGSAVSGAPHPRVGEDVLPGYLDTARRLFGARCDAPDDRPSGLPPELEELREFHLPPVCLMAPPLAGAPVG